MLMPDYFETAADGLLELYTQLDDSVIRDIVRRILKTGTVTDTAKWQIQKAQESGLLYDEIISEVAKITDASTAQVKVLFEDSGIEAVKWDSSIYEAAGLSPVPLLMSPAALRVLNAGYKKTLGQMRNLTLTTASQAQQTFINAVSLAELQVTSGAFDYNMAIKNAVKTASQEGAWVQYPTGHRDRVDVAVRRAVLTGVGQTCAQVSMAYADNMGCDLVETTAHPGARPSHMEWQGKIFSRSGQNPRYPDFESSTGYGTGAGLCGYNCRHSFYPYFEGLSASAYPREKLQEYENKTVDYNDEQISYYDATQIQRKMEREIRETRRQLVGSDEALKNVQDEALKKTFQDDFANQSFQLKKKEAKLDDFLNQTGISGQSDRVQVQGFGHSQSQKAVYAAGQKMRTMNFYPGEKSMLGLANEHAIVYDKYGNVLIKTSGSAARVTFTAEQKTRMAGRIMSHNHPNNSPLSDSDLFSMWSLGLDEVRAVTSHGIFSVKNPDVWKTIPNKTTMRSELRSIGKKFIPAIQKKIDAKKLTMDEAEYLIDRISMRRLTRKYGLKMELIKWP